MTPKQADTPRIMRNEIGILLNRHPELVLDWFWIEGDGKDKYWPDIAYAIRVIDNDEYPMPVEFGSNDIRCIWYAVNRHLRELKQREK